MRLYLLKIFSLEYIMKQKKILVLLSVFFVTLASAHEFWLAPNRYFYKINDTVNIIPSVGEDFKADVWANREKRTLWVKCFSLQHGMEISESLKVSDSFPISFKPKSNGNYLIALQSKPSFIALAGYKFEEYLKEDGIENIAQYRLEHNDTAKSSREFYQRCAKTLIQVGDKQDTTYKVKTNMPLEITPLTNPYTLKKQDSLAVRFEFKGKPLANQTVRSWCKAMDSLKVKAFHKTNMQGIAIIPIKEHGEWMISLVKMELYNDTSKADYESFWGSYSFFKR